MNYAWLMAPHEYEPDYDSYWRDLESLEDAMADVASYDDWFVAAALANDNVPGARMRSGEETLMVRAA